MNYYEEILNDIQRALDKQELEEAGFLLKRELEMPYIPKEYEDALLEKKKEYLYLKGNKTTSHTESLESLLHKLKGKPQSQLYAAEKLFEHNLRTCIEPLQDYLSKDPVPEAASLVIEALIEQEINAEFVYTKDGIEYTFYPDSLTPLMRSPGFFGALKRCEKELSKNPSVQEMVKTLIIKEAYARLPMEIEEEESEALFDQCYKEVQQCFV